jgi:ATPase subunit of ABC transporter with duplicated ATPase domains
MASYQYVYVMKNLTKAFPGGREVFKGITLSFLPGVKIGVLGVNDAGKSTLLKIMAGIETEYGGEAWAEEGVRVGYLARSCGSTRIRRWPRTLGSRSGRWPRRLNGLTRFPTCSPSPWTTSR